MSQRTDRVDELLRQEIGEILRRDVDDPRIGFATITDVETTPDLRHARVWVSVIGSDEERRATMAALGRAMGFVQRELGHRLRLKRIPALHVELDDTAQRGTRLLRLLEGLETGHIPHDLPVGETLPTPVARIGREGDSIPEEDLEATGTTETPGRPTRPARVARIRRGRVHQGGGGERGRRPRKDGGR